MNYTHSIVGVRWLLAVVVLLSAASAHATDFIWNAGSGGSFQNGLNWSSLFGFPSVGDTAIFGNPVGSYLVDFAGNAISNGLQFSQGTVNFTINFGQTYTVTDSNGFSLGTTSGKTANLRISSGALSLTGNNSSDSGNGGGIGSIGGATGNLTVNGPGVSFTANVGYCDIGVAGTGTVTVQSGATASIGNQSYLGVDSTGNGAIAVTGTGSSMTLGTSCIVGYAGSGTLTISNGATASIGNSLIVSSIVNSNGTITVGGSGAGTLALNGGSIGNGFGTNGNLNINASGTLNSNGNLKVSAGGTATLNGTWNQTSGLITVQGGILNLDGGTLTATAAGTGITVSSGMLNVNGGSPTIGNLTRSGTGSVNLTDGTLKVTSLFNNGNTSQTINGNSSSASPQLVLDSGAITTGLTDVIVGLTGRGTLTVMGGSILNASTLSLANSAGGAGTVNVSSNSQILLSGNEYVGYSGTGNFNQNGGSQTVASNLYIGFSTGSIGNYMLTGGTVVVSGTTDLKAGSLSIDGGSWTTGLLASEGAGNSIGLASDPPSSTALVINDNNPVHFGAYTETLLGSGSILKTGASTQTLVLRTGFSGLVTVNGGALILQGTSTPPTSLGNFTVNSGGTLQLGDAALHNDVLGIPVTGMPTLNVNAGGILTTASGTTHNLGIVNLVGGTLSGSATPLAGYSDYTLNDVISADTSASGAAGISMISAAGGINLRNNITFNVSSGPGELLITAPIHDEPGVVGSLTKIGNGTLVLSAGGSYTGGTTINSGTLVAAYTSGNPGGTFAGGSNVTVNLGGTLQLNGIDSLGYYGGSPVLNITTGMVTTDGSLSHSNVGSINLTGGTLAAAGSGDLYGNYILNETINSLASSSTSTISAAKISLRNDSGHLGGTFDVVRGTAPIDLLISADIAPLPGDIVGLSKIGDGILKLTGANSYNGGTMISNGTLVIGAAGALPAGSAVVNNASLVISANATAGNLSGTGTTSLTGGVTLTASSFTQGGLTMQLAGAAPGTNAKLSVIGALAPTGKLAVSFVTGFTPAFGNSFDLFDWGTLSGGFSTIQLPELPSGLVWSTSLLYINGVLKVTDTNHVVGDFNRDGEVTAADIPVMLKALADLDAYASINSLNPAQLAAIGDFDSSGTITNRDIQGLLDLVANQPGGGAVTAVPEPSTIILAALGMLAAAGTRFGRRFYR